MSSPSTSPTLRPRRSTTSSSANSSTSTTTSTSTTPSTLDSAPPFWQSWILLTTLLTSLLSSLFILSHTYQQIHVHIADTTPLPTIASAWINVSLLCAIAGVLGVLAFVEDREKALHAYWGRDMRVWGVYLTVVAALAFLGFVLLEGLRAEGRLWFH